MVRTPKKKPRAARRCKKCPGKPLQSECIHSVASKARNIALQHSANPEVSASTGQTVPVAQSAPEPTANPMSQAVTPSVVHAHGYAATHMPQIDSALQIDPVLLFLGDSTFLPPTVTSVAACPTNAQFTPIPASPAQALPLAPAIPAFQWNSQQKSPTPEPFQANVHNDRNDNRFPDGSLPSGEYSSLSGGHDHSSPGPSTTLSSTTSSPAKRVRVSSKNAMYKKVVGAMRGNSMLAIPRQKSLRPPLENAAHISQRFNREIATIISRCERLSEETSCWLFIAAQQASSGTAATHFTSSRLRKEATVDSADLINRFQSLTSNLLCAKRSEALHLAKKLAEVEEKYRSAEAAAEKSRAALAAQAAEIEEKSTLIAQYEALGLRLEATAG